MDIEVGNVVVISTGDLGGDFNGDICRYTAASRGRLAHVRR